MSEICTAPKRLVDLNPRWDGDGRYLVFDCPCGDRASCSWGGTVWLTIANALPGAVDDRMGSKHQWQRAGETFETLTLSPSLHLVGHWHGWVRDGQVVSV